MADQFTPHVIYFPLTPAAKPSAIEFLPFGTRTLKIKVTNPDHVSGNLVLRSEHLPDEFGKSVFFSHEQGGTDFRLSWGGGHERGACLCGKDKELAGTIKFPIEECVELLDPPPGKPTEPPTSYIYLNLAHTGGAFDQSRTLMLAVYPEADMTTKPLHALALTLDPPTVVDPARFVRTDSGTASTLTLVGSQVPSYLPRWWSPAEVAYASYVPTLPNLSIHMAGQDLEVQSKSDLGDRILVKVHDNIPFQDISQYRDVQAEIYHFTKHYFVLRLWFSWLWKDGLHTANNEIPDAERFDFVLDAEERRLVYAATDTHWREAWVPTPDDPDEAVEVQLGLFSDTVVNKLFEHDQNSFIKWMTSGSQHHSAVDAQYLPSRLVQNILDEGPYAAKDLGAGWEAHVPYFVNCPPPEGENFVSSDPRNG